MRIAILALACCSLGGCGLASRATFAQLDLRQGGRPPDPALLTSLRGSDPTLPFLWAQSAKRSIDPANLDPAPALELLARAKLYLPDNPALSTAWVDMAGLVGPEEQLAAADTMLAELPASPVEAWLRASRVRALVELGRLDEAEQETLRQGAVYNTSPYGLSDSWARVALALEALGERARADRCLDLSLEKGPGGLGTLAMEVARRPERQAAARSLRRRAVTRHPAHPDLGLAQVDEALAGGDAAHAQELLEALPSPLPGRMRSQVAGLSAHLALVQGRVDEALATVRSRLTSAPTDRPALMVLWDIWTQHGRPPRATVATFYQRALERTNDSQLAERLQSALEVLSQETVPVPENLEPTPAP